MTKKTNQGMDRVVLRICGDSGDGMQVIGELFSHASVTGGNDICTFPDYPAEIRAPLGTIPGVSGYQIQFGGQTILTPGDALDALVAFNPAALKANLAALKVNGLLLVDVSSFTETNLAKAGYEVNPLDSLDETYKLMRIDIVGEVSEALRELDLKKSERVRSKNFFVLGFLYWLYSRPIDYTMAWIHDKWKKKPVLAEANETALKAGFYLGETSEIVPDAYHVAPMIFKEGRYRKVNGNQAVALGFVAAAHCFDHQVVYGSYPITPASGILESLSSCKNLNVKTVQAEDEIAAVAMAIGASYAGDLGVTGTSGPGMCLKAEGIGLAVMAELPLVVVNVQRGGPSTGLPTKTEQADLLQALHGRNGESPLPVLAARSPADCFDCTIEASRIALKYKTPVILLSDGYIANGAEPWQIPDVKDLPKEHFAYAESGHPYTSYKRDSETLARTLAIPGTRDLEHRIGGLEKDEQGTVCYDAENHDAMCRVRCEKVNRVAKDYAPTEVFGSQQGDLLILAWGGTYGAVHSAFSNLRLTYPGIGYVHLRHIHPFPDDLAAIIGRFKRFFIPEINLGQLNALITSRYHVETETFHQMQGRPFSVSELEETMQHLLNESASKESR